MVYYQYLNVTLFIIVENRHGNEFYFTFTIITQSNGKVRRDEGTHVFTIHRTRDVQEPPPETLGTRMP